MGIYTYDTNVEDVPMPSANTDPTTPPEAESNSFLDYDDEFAEHPDILAMRYGINAEFLEAFQRGFRHYRNGEWDEAVAVLKQTAQTLRKNFKGQSVEDGPSLTLLDVMAVGPARYCPPYHQTHF
jgi:hypothetical protein